METLKRGISFQKEACVFTIVLSELSVRGLNCSSRSRIDVTSLFGIRFMTLWLFAAFHASHLIKISLQPSLPTASIREFPKIRGTFLGPRNKDYSIWGSILGSPYFGKLP